MKSIINLFWGICLLRQSPAAVPGQGWFVVLVIAANLVVSLLITLPLADNPGVPRTVMGLVIGQAVTATLFWLVLGARNRRERFTTVIAAYFGCDILITICLGLALPLLQLLPPLAFALVSIVFMVWLVTVMGHILHRAADIPFGIGCGLALGMAVLGGTASQIAISA